jgi:hypothetical protein
MVTYSVHVMYNASTSCALDVSNSARKVSGEGVHTVVLVFGWSLRGMPSRYEVLTYTHTYTRIHTHIHTYVDTHIHTYRQTDRQTYVRAYMHTCIYLRTQARPITQGGFFGERKHQEPTYKLCARRGIVQLAARVTTQLTWQRSSHYRCTFDTPTNAPQISALNCWSPYVLQEVVRVRKHRSISSKLVREAERSISPSCDMCRKRDYLLVVRDDLERMSSDSWLAHYAIMKLLQRLDQNLSKLAFS